MWRSGCARLAWVLTIILASAMLACGGGDGSGPSVTLTDEALRLMGLAQQDLGEPYASFPQLPSVLQSREEMIKFASDDEDQDIAKFDALKTYRERYQSDEAVTEVKGPFAVGTTATLFGSEGGASGYLEDDARDAEGQVGTFNPELRIDEVVRFDVEGIGEEALGLRVGMTVEPATNPLRADQTMVMFRRGVILGIVSVYSMGAEDLREQVKGLAAKLDQRIQAVLTGEVQPTPSEATPTAEATLSAQPTPTAEAASTAQPTPTAAP